MTKLKLFLKSYEKSLCGQNAIYWLFTDQIGSFTDFFWLLLTFSDFCWKRVILTDFYWPYQPCFSGYSAALKRSRNSNIHVKPHCWAFKPKINFWYFENIFSQEFLVSKEVLSCLIFPKNSGNPDLGPNSPTKKEDLYGSRMFLNCFNHC